MLASQEGVCWMELLYQDALT